ncbi:MAG: ADP-glyceromanno-heptose 6-epimerase [Nitrospinae bacterium]|nr:ADP-glyceromanno-heptose 6-epimerase [Nitrospinota bacterium]
MIVVTGGAGFIGSAVIHALNLRGISDILLVDQVDHPEKERNLAFLQYHRLAGKDEFLRDVVGRSARGIETIVHLGACSSTTETDVGFLRANNFEYTRQLALYALEKGARFVYASSAATYGAGEMGYSDDEARLETFRPLNPYGQSKQDFDLWAREQKVLDKIAGLKYFNVYGPNEYHKGDMQSMVRKGFLQARDAGKIRLFKSYRPEYPDGGQLRDFVYIRDAVEMTLFFLDRPDVGGIFNVGTGEARNWNDLARAIFSAMDQDPVVEYVPMPENIRNQYQYFTQAEMGKIRRAGYGKPIATLEEGVRDYVRNYLLPGKRLGE